MPSLSQFVFGVVILFIAAILVTSVGRIIIRDYFKEKRTHLHKLSSEDENTES